VAVAEKCNGKHRITVSDANCGAGFSTAGKDAALGATLLRARIFERSRGKCHCEPRRNSS